MILTWLSGDGIDHLHAQTNRDVDDNLVTQINVVGLEGDLLKQVNAYIEQPMLDRDEDIGQFADALAGQAKKSLQAVGYYDAEITTRHSSYKNSVSIQLVVDAGPPIIIDKLSINISGEAADNQKFQIELGNLPVHKGKILNHSDYERSKDLLYSTARNLGYFDAKFSRTQVLVSQKKHQAEIFIDFDSGQRYVIDEVKYVTELFDDQFLKRWQPFGRGAPYRASYAVKLTENLQNSGYFKYVRVKPDLTSAIGNKVPLLVELEPANENILSLGVGYATDTGLRVKGNWVRPHHNAKGHTLRSNASLSNQRQEFSASYEIPHRLQPATGKYTLDLGVLNHRTDDTYSQLRTMNFSDQRLTKSDWYREIFLRLENENSYDTNDRINLLLPGFSYSRTKSTGGLKPSKGTFLSFKVLGGTNKLFSDINMLRGTVSAKHLTSWHRRHYLISRAELGFLDTSDFSRVPTSHRFFAGGDNSVRGFSYQSISPLNAANEATGGRYLTTASTEYNWYFRDQWALAAFVDTGRAYMDSDAPYRVGVGAGIRWLSPVGPVRVDIGYGISEPDPPIRLHLSIGPQL